LVQKWAEKQRISEILKRQTRKNRRAGCDNDIC
jgi:hypothetical protein